MATAHGRTAAEKGSEIPLSPVGSESEKPAQENIENAAPSKQTSGGSDEEAQQHEFKLSKRNVLALTALAFLWTGSQIPVYLFGAIPPYIYADVGGSDRWTWITLSNLLALAAVCPFVGSLSDLFGRRYIALSGAGFVVLGMIIVSTARTMNIVIGGMVFAGVGAGINELTALAAASEMSPVAQRGKYVSLLVLSIVPFCISALYAQLIAAYSSWRYVGLFCALWNGVGLLMTACFYFPPPRANPDNMTSRQILAQTDITGGFLSIVGMILFLAGMQWGGYMYDWTSPHVLAPLLLGAAFLAAFLVWEARFAPFPMFPRRINQSPRVLVLTLVITFISGANFVSLIAFWPTQAYNVYGHDPVLVGVRAIPIGVALMAGAVVVLYLLSVFRGANRALMVLSSVLMTAGCGSMAVARVDNMDQLWGLLILAGLGIGGIVVPASIITMIVCPDDLIATVAALTLSIRVIGGSVGYSIYYNVFVNKFVPNADKYIGGALIAAGIDSPETIALVIQYTSDALPARIAELPGIAGNQTLYDEVIYAGQVAYAMSYQYVYLASIAFGVVSTVCALFLGDVSAYMDDHVAVVM